MTSKTPSQKYTTIHASELRAGDLLHYTAAEAWRIESTSYNGKSIDTTFVVEQSEDGGSLGTGGEHRFRQSTYVRVMRVATGGSKPDVAPVTMAAGDILADDIVHYSAHESWMVQFTNFVGKSVDVDFIFETNEKDAGAVGTTSAHRFRQSTNVLVTRR
jgi:hypothetical protein